MIRARIVIEIDLDAYRPENAAALRVMAEELLRAADAIDDFNRTSA